MHDDDCMCRGCCLLSITTEPLVYARPTEASDAEKLRRACVANKACELYATLLGFKPSDKKARLIANYTSDHDNAQEILDLIFWSA